MTEVTSQLHADHRSLPGPEDIYREVLPNGIVVLARSNFSSPSVTISGYVRAGSILDPDDKLGLADFAVSALMRGTAQHSFDELYNELESVGASIGFDSGMNSTGFHGHALAEDTSLLLSLLAEAMCQPTFPRAEVEKLRHHLLAGLALREQDTADMADITFDKILFKNHPYARSEDGSPTTIKAITRADLMKFHRLAFGPQGMAIAVVGAVEPKRAAALVRKALGGWKNPSQVDIPVVSEPKRLAETVKRQHTIAGKSQSDLIIGTNGPRRKDLDYMAAALGNSVLGQFGMMGRVGKSVRETSGLAYYVYSNLSAGIGPGSWSISAGVNPANVQQASALIVEELARFVRDGVTDEELADSKANFIGRLPLSFESNAGVATALLNMERYDLGFDYFHRYDGLVNAVQREQVVEVARKWINPEQLAIAVAGPTAK